MLSEQFSEIIIKAVETMPAAAVIQLTSDLDNLNKQDDSEKSSANFISQSLTKISERFSSPSIRYTVNKLLDGWEVENRQNPGLTLRELTSAIGILILNRAKNQDHQKIELVWTGPASRIPVRQTRQVLSQLINGAQKELLIISFVVFKIPEILELLKSALHRGVSITCILESPEESDGKITFQGFAEFNVEILRQIKILVWDKEMRPASLDGKTGTLHAKVAVADQSVSFISSANLTINAMTLNMELGLLLYNKAVAQEIAAHFDQLTLNGVLKTRIINT